jgi:TetR/AcrR family transcriptional regulator
VGERPRPSASTRERILDAAEALFAQRGLRGVGVREIAQASGLTPASLYNHFPGKQALYEAVLERGLRPLQELLESLAPRDLGPETVDELVPAIMQHLARRPHLPRLVFHEASSGGAHLSQLARRWMRPLVAQAERELKRDPHGAVREEDLPALISSWIHLVFGHFAMAPLLSEVFDRDLLAADALERQTRLLAQLIRQTVERPPPAPRS